MIKAAATTVRPGFNPGRTALHLGYDYIFDSSSCGDFSPVILDSDGALRWVSPLAEENALFAASTFFDNAVYVTQYAQLFRIELDGTVLWLQTIAISA